MKPKAAAVAAAIATQNASARRNARARNTSFVSIELEADRANVDDELPLHGGIKFATEVADLHVDDIRLRHELEIPDAFEKHGARQDLVGAAHEIFEQFEFLRHEIDRSPRATDGAIDQVHFQQANFQPGRARVAPSTEKRLDTGAQFADVERLDQIVVAAGFQPANSSRRPKTTR